MDYTNQLTFEQEFQLILYKKKINSLDNIAVKQYLIATLKQMMIKDNLIKFFIKNNIP